MAFSDRMKGSYSSALADAVARWDRIQGKSAFMTTGTDEHGQKVQKEAEKRKMDVKQYCDTIASSFQDELSHYSLAIDRFIRTTDDDHVAVGAAKKLTPLAGEEGVGAADGERGPLRGGLHGLLLPLRRGVPHGEAGLREGRADAEQGERQPGGTGEGEELDVPVGAGAGAHPQAAEVQAAAARLPPQPPLVGSSARRR